MAKKSVLVLGVTGRIGPSLLEELRQHDKDYEIIVGIHKTKLKDFKSKKIDLGIETVDISNLIKFLIW